MDPGQQPSQVRPGSFEVAGGLPVPKGKLQADPRRVVSYAAPQTDNRLYNEFPLDAYNRIPPRSHIVGPPVGIPQGPVPPQMRPQYNFPFQPEMPEPFPPLHDELELLGNTLPRRKSPGVVVPTPAAKTPRMSMSEASPRPEVGDDPESDLKRIALDSLRFPLERAVAHVREDDNSPLAEKSRQVFGMSWLLRSCEAKPDANIPRNRIYAHYVNACDDFKLKPLNHASFGKLVRMVFPNIKTRRLGVRGHSKYHYCGVALLESAALTRTPSPNLGTPQSNLMDSFSPASMQTESPPVNTSVSSAASPLSRPTPKQTPAYADLWALLHRSPSEEFIVPQIQNFVGPDADCDTVTTLHGLYKSHCRALLGHLRSTQFKQLISQFSGFHSSVAVPVQRLLQRTDTVYWMLECDKRLFSEMALVFAPLSLKPLSTEWTHCIHGLRMNLLICIDQQRMSMPDHYVQLKKKYAQPLIRMLDRLLRANEAAHNANKILMNEADIRKMKTDWLELVTPAAARDAPCNQEFTELVIKNEIPQLLDNANDAAGPLMAWMHYLVHLRARYPAAPIRIFSLGLSAVATTALRDISRRNGTSFGAWWIFRSWIDEWVGWLVEFVELLEQTEGSGEMSQLFLNRKSPSV